MLSWRRMMVTKIFEHISEEKYKFVQITNGIWRQLTEAEV
jgi:hypothetical protein